MLKLCLSSLRREKERAFSITKTDLSEGGTMELGMRSEELGMDCRLADCVRIIILALFPLFSALLKRALTPLLRTFGRLLLFLPLYYRFVKESP